MLIRCTVPARGGRRRIAALSAAASAAAVVVVLGGCSRPPATTSGAARADRPTQPVEAAVGAAGAGNAVRGRPGQLPDSATFPPVPPAAPAVGGSPGYVGVVLARQAVNVAAEVDGRLASISVRVGDPVRRGEQLAALSTEELRDEMAVARAAAGAARGELRRAELELDRTRDRRARREIHPELYSDEDLAGARNAEQEAAASLDSARERAAEEAGRLRQLETRLQHAVLRSPIDGRVALRYVDAGALVHSGAPVLRLISTGDFMLRFAVPPEQAAAIRQGAAVEVRLDSLPLTLAGRVSRVAPRIDPASQMVFVEADLQLPAGWAGRLQDGLAGRVTVSG
jgi:RND family efflux transporter MFP subunit